MLNEDGLRYNFVFLFAESDYWRAILGTELYTGEHSRTYETAFDGSPMLQKLFHYHWAYSLNCKIQMPFKSLWFHKMYQHDFKNELPLCFVFMGGNNIRFDAGFCGYVRKKDPRNRIIILHNDLISKHINYNYEDIRKKADLITTYDLDEAKQFGIEYFQETTYSKLIPEPEKPKFEYDVYFLGAAKDRLPKIHATYQYLTQNGCKCKFIVTGVPPEKQIEGIEYSKGISYEQNLRYIISSRIVLEIIQGGSCDITTRALEAIAYRRKFLTDCPLDLTEFFHQKQLCKFEKPQDIDLRFLKDDFKPDDFQPKADLSPLKRLYFMQEKLDGKDAK